MNWKDATAETLRVAVTQPAPGQLEALWTEAVSRGWVKDTEHIRHQFYATVCYAVTDTQVRDAKGWLISIVKAGKWGVGLSGELVDRAEDRARQLIRQVDGVAALPRASRRIDEPAGRSASDQIDALKRLAGAAS